MDDALLETATAEQDAVLAEMWWSLGFTRPPLMEALLCGFGAVSTPTTTTVSVCALSMLVPIVALLQK